MDPVLPASRPKIQPRSRRRFASLRSISALVLREMSTTYGKSPGGYLWAVLDPIAGIALLTVVFSIFFRTPSLGTNFALFYATGVLPFNIFMTTSTAVSQSLNFSRPLLAYPAVTWVDAILARFILNFLTQVLVAYVVFAGILLLFETRVIVDVPVVAGALLLAGILGLGIGVLNCMLITRWQVYQRIWSIATRPLFLISAVMFLLQTIPQPWRDMMWYNPIVHVIGLVRHGFYTNYDASYVSVLYVLGISGITLVLGLVFLSRYHRDLINM